MGILTTLFQKDAIAPRAGIGNAWSWNRFFYDANFMAPTKAGQYVTPDTARTVAAVYACVKVLSEDIAKLPFFLYKRLVGDNREKATSNPLFTRLHSRPNRWQTSFEWREMMMGHALLRGNAYSWDDPKTSELIPLSPDRVRVDMPERTLRYRWRRPDGSEKTLDADEVWHLRGYSSDGVTGDSVISAMRDTVGLAMAADTHGSRFFKNAAQVPFALMHPDTLSDVAAERLKASFAKDYGGAENVGKTPVFEEGMKIEKIGLTNEDSQFLETREFQVLDIARFFRMPPHKIQSMKDATFSNIEHQAIEYVVDTLMPWAARFEQTTDRCLVRQPGAFFTELELKGLLRGDMAARSTFYNQAITGGWMNRNQVRRLENEEPGPPELDEYLVPKNMGVAGEDPEPPPAPSFGTAPDVPPPPDENQQAARAIVRIAARRYVRQEVKTVLKHAEKYSRNTDGWAGWLKSFYRRQRTLLAEGLLLSAADAQAYCDGQIQEILAHGVHIVEAWEEEKGAALEELALKGA